jgi:hypothetical protein
VPFAIFEVLTAVFLRTHVSWEIALYRWWRFERTQLYNIEGSKSPIKMELKTLPSSERSGTTHLSNRTISQNIRFQNYFPKFYFVTELYMFRASSVPIIRSYQLYTWQLVCFMQVMWPLPSRVREPDSPRQRFRSPRGPLEFFISFESEVNTALPPSCASTSWSLRGFVIFSQNSTNSKNFKTVWPCIVIDSFWIKPTDTLSSNFIGIATLRVSGSLSAHHQEFLAYIGIGTIYAIWWQSTTRSRIGTAPGNTRSPNWINCTNADVRLRTPDDGQKDCPKHAES